MKILNTLVERLGLTRLARALSLLAALVLCLPGFSHAACPDTPQDCVTNIQALADRVTAAILGVRQIVVDPSTPTTLYAVVHGSGVYTSVAGGNWVATAGQPSNLSVTALVMKDSNTLFAATDGGGVFISNDQGTHWQVCPNVNAGLTNLNLRTLMLVGGTLYAGATSGIFKSTDQCTNWTAMSTGLPQ